MDPNLVFHTDRYQLTMMAAYARTGLGERRAVFELFVRKLPPCRRYLVACGIGRILRALPQLRFGSDQLAHLDADPVLAPVLKDPVVRRAFEEFRFRGRVLAIPEGRVCLPGEPIARVEGTLLEAQLLETLLLSAVNHDTRVASKCARIVEAARGRNCFEFGGRRTHEVAAVDSARAAYIAGFIGTSNEEAALRYGVPVLGTMAHAFITAYAADAGEEGESTAFADFAATFPTSTTALVDTFDTVRGTQRAVEAAGARLAGVRIDSGDLDALSREVRSVLDQAGRPEARVVLSNDLDETQIASMIERGTPVDAFGVGTMAVCTPDAPALGAVYKLVALQDQGGQWTAVQKRAPGKGGTAAPKQVLRRDGSDWEDLLVIDGEERAGWSPILEPVMEQGELVDDSTPAQVTAAARRRCRADLERASVSLRTLAPRTEQEGFPLRRSDRLNALLAEVDEHGHARWR